MEARVALAQVAGKPAPMEGKAVPVAVAANPGAGGSDGSASDGNFPLTAERNAERRNQRNGGAAG